MSTDGGTVWIQKDSYYSDGGAVAADPTSSNNYYSGGNYTFAMFASRTTDAGSTWARYNLTAIGMVYALAIDPSNVNIVYAAGYPGVYKTTNGGGQWNSMSTGIVDTVRDLAINPVATNTVYAATRGGVYKTTNGGTLWTSTGTADARAVVVDPSGPETLYVATSSGVRSSTNAGSTWSDMSAGLPAGPVTALDINPGHYLFAGTPGNGAHRWPLSVGAAEGDAAHCDAGPSLVIAPNPAGRILQITCRSSGRRDVFLELLDVSGRRVAVIFDGRLETGSNEIRFNTDRLENGVYFLRLETGASAVTGKLIVSR